MQDLNESFYKARNNVISMLIDRGYKDQATGETSDLQNRYISFDEFKELSQVGDVAIDLGGILTKDNIPVYVKFFMPKGKSSEITVADLFNNKDAGGIFNDVATQVFKREQFKSNEDLRKFFKDVKLIVVFVAGRNSKGKFLMNVETSFTMPEYDNIELWPVHRLQVNYPNHILIKPHEILSEIDKQAVLHRFNLNASMMPEMCIDDPINRWYCGKPGEVYKVSRGTAPHYVIVVSRKMPQSG